MVLIALFPSFTVQTIPFDNPYDTHLNSIYKTSKEHKQPTSGRSESVLICVLILVGRINTPVVRTLSDYGNINKLAAHYNSTMQDFFNNGSALGLA